MSYTPDCVVFTNYTYRPDGLRHSIGDKVHVWDGANIVADVDGNEVIVYIRGVNLIYADDGDKTYYHFNAHGDVVVLTNESGTKTKSYSYNAFGVEYNEATLDDNPFRYCGEYYDKETKTIYLRARYYDAEQGRFTQEDPIRDGYNWYSYCGGNPVNFIDPRGTDASAIPWRESLEAIIAAALLEPTFIGEIIAAVSIVTFLVTAALIAEDAIDSGTMSGTDSKVDTDVEVEADAKSETENKSESKTYYHVTSFENAQSIMSSQMLIGSEWEGGYVYAWETLPTPYAIENSGAHFGVIISFKTDAVFEEDWGIVDPMVKASSPVVSVLPGPIEIYDVMIVGGYDE